MKSLFKLYVILIVMGIALFPIYAYASSSSQAGQSGESAAPISGWDVSNVKYQFSNDPSIARGVGFDLNGAANHVSVKVTAPASSYTDCINVFEHHWQCNFASDVSISSMDELRVIAAGN